mmetsp:Transcript_8213/g.11439  ORF Transcript_8213/g.11439 Transcript_8213/m.11439 type:complete len:644 (+) Transcript_8213:740-2671(+)
MFISVKGAYDSILANATDLKELIPEFYHGDGSFLLNARRVPLGTTQAGNVVADVELPPWSHNSPQLLITKLRAALESDYVSQHLPAWIDLIFGYNQEHPDNLFHPLTYEHNVNKIRQTITQSHRDMLALETQIDEFGQTPSRIFDQPHPPRRSNTSLQSSPLDAKQRRQSTLEKVAPKSISSNVVPSLSIEHRRSPLEAVGVSPLDASKLLSAKAPPPTKEIMPLQDAKSRKLSMSPPPLSTCIITNKKNDWTQLPTSARIRGIRANEKSFTRAHRDAITGVACESNIVVSSSRDGTLKLNTCLDFENQKRWFVPRRTVASPARAPLTCVCLTHDARYTLTAGADARLFIFIVETGKLLTTVDNCHDAPITAVTCCKGSSSDIYDVATCGLDACVKLWQFAHEEMSLSLELYDHETPVTSVALRAFTNIVTAGAEDGQLLIWDARETSGSILGRSKLGDNTICAVSIVGAGPNGDTVFAADTFGLLVQFSLYGHSLARIHLRNDIAHMIAIDARKATSNLLHSSPKKPNGPYIFVAVGDGDIVLLDWSQSTPIILTKRKAHVSAIAAFALLKSSEIPQDLNDDNDFDHIIQSTSSEDLLDVALISAAEDCTLKAWEILRHQEEDSTHNDGTYDGGVDNFHHLP